MKILIKNVLHDGKITNIFIENGKFIKIGNINCSADLEINGKDKAIFPSFFNTHTHAPMNLLRGIGEDKNLFDWLQQDIWPLEDKFTKDDFYIGTKFCILEMIKTGTTFFNDMYSATKDETLQAVAEMGVRSAISHVNLDFFTKEEREKRMQRTKNFLAFKNPCPERIIKSLSCHAIYTCSHEILEFSVKIAKENDMFLHVHNSETKQEVDDCVAKYKMTPTELFYKLGILTDKTILAHCVHLNDHDIELIKKTKSIVAHNPTSNMKLNSGQMQLQKYLDSGLRITLGTDGASSNNSLSMLSEMKVCGLSAKIQANSPLAGKVADIFKMATKNGADAFGINAGEIKEGKLADFFLVDLNNTLMLPSYNLISNLIYSADSSCITDTFCNGIPLMLNRKVKGEKKIINDFNKRFKNLISI